jgi:hypothetical protein
MTIIRAPRPERNFSIINNEIIRNQQLTYRARGILAFLLSQPDHWRTNTDRLAYPNTEGRDAIRSAMNELQLAGYVVLVKRQRANGQWLSEWLVYDEPAQNRSVDDLWITSTNDTLPKPEKPTSDNQALKERLTNKIDVKESQTLLKTMTVTLCTTCNGSGKNASTTNKGYIISICGTCKGAGTQ